jgi:non-specific serine/threonine protein kinase
LQILTTSREPLGVAGEVTWIVPPLSVPEAGRPNKVEEIAATESVVLFVERARYRRPTFALREQDVPAVTEICLRLDGIPLAIELAAARVGTMSLEKIAARIGDSLGLLTGGSRLASPRQQTLRGALAWSHHLLSEREQMLFARLSVFAGGWMLEAAETVASGDGVEVGEVLDLLSGLVDKSLVVAEAADGDVRYRMLEPVRRYAWEQLVESGVSNELQSRHAAYFLAEAEVTEPELVGPRQGWWLDRLEREHANMRAALSWALMQRDEVGLQLAVALSRFWYTRGHLSEARRWLERGLTTNGESPTLVRAKALGEAGWLAEEQVDYERARVAYEESLNIYRKLDDDKGVAETLGNLGLVTLFQGDHGRAARQLEEHLGMLRLSGNERDIALALVRLGLLAIHLEEYTRATTLLEEALSLIRRGGDIRGVAVTLNNLGFATLCSGNSERAAALFEEALSKNQEVGDTRGVGASLLNLGLAALSQADYERAEELLRESLKTLADAEDEQAVVECLEAMAGVAGARGQAERAVRLWGATRALREGIGATMVPGERAILEPHLASAHSRLGTEAWDAALTEGRGMTSEQAVEYALSQEAPEPQVSPTPERRQPVGAQLDVLTHREEEVAAMVAQGLSNRQIAQELFLSERTIENHVSKILRKLELTSRTEIAAWATVQRLLSTNPD